MPNRLGKGRDLSGGQIPGQNRKRTPRHGNAAVARPSACFASAATPTSPPPTATTPATRNARYGCFRPHERLCRVPVLHPASSSWLNLAERWFAELTNRKLRRPTHRSVTELEGDIRKWINEWNKNPSPFVWTKSADDILETLADYCQRIINSGH